MSGPLRGGFFDSHCIGIDIQTDRATSRQCCIGDIDDGDSEQLQMCYYRKMQFWDQLAVYRKNGRLIGNRMRSIEWRH